MAKQAQGNRQSADLFVATKYSGEILLSVGGFGPAQAIRPIDLISLCVRRVKSSTNTSRDTAS